VNKLREIMSHNASRYNDRNFSDGMEDTDANKYENESEVSDWSGDQNDEQPLERTDYNGDDDSSGSKEDADESEAFKQPELPLTVAALQPACGWATYVCNVLAMPSESVHSCEASKI
jgi:hypothetical protein